MGLINRIIYFAIFAVFVFLGAEIQPLFNIAKRDRSPASKIENSTCLELIKSFYSAERSKLTASIVQSTANDSHMFFRSFPPLFYKLMEKNQWKKEFSKLSKIESIMAGDAHMENFGLKFFKEKLRLSVNDYDDLTRGPIILDVIRLLTSARLAGVEVDEKLVEDFLKKYTKGIKGKNHDFSNVVKDSIESSLGKTALNEHQISIENKIFIKKKVPNKDLTLVQKEEWRKLLNEYGTVKDSYSYVKQSGGSAGLTRYEFLVEKNNELKWIEAKEWAEPSYNVGAKVNPPNESDRYNWIITYDRPYTIPQITSYNGKTFYLRSIDDRQTGISLTDLHKKDVEDVLMDEAFALGDFHQFYLKDSKDFAKELDQIDYKKLVEVVKGMEKEIKSAMKDVTDK